MNLRESHRILKAMKQLCQTDSTRTLNELRILIAMERVVARIESHEILREQLIFKGGFVMLKNFDSPRFTRDIDALTQDLRKSQLKTFVTTALQKDLEDGLWYGEIQFEDLKLQGSYGGLRISFAFHIGAPPSEPLKRKKLSRLHVDLSFDSLLNHIKKEKMCSFLEGISPVSWSVYPIEWIIAEKLEAVFSRGSINSRAKDIFDLNFLLPKIKNKRSLKEAIQKTFQKRPTPIPTSFAQTAYGFDIEILKTSWLSVEIDTQTRSFEDQWKQFLIQLENYIDG